MLDHLTVVTHPLVQHKLTIMRKKETSTGGFRRLLREISLLLAYEVTRGLDMTTTRIKTPMEEMDAPQAASIPGNWDCVMTFIIRRLFCRRYRHRESAVKTLARGARHQVSFAAR